MERGRSLIFRRGMAPVLSIHVQKVYTLFMICLVYFFCLYLFQNTESEKKLLEFMYNLAGLFQCASKGEVGDSHREKLQAYFTGERLLKRE